MPVDMSAEEKRSPKPIAKPYSLPQPTPYPTAIRQSVSRIFGEMSHEASLAKDVTRQLSLRVNSARDKTWAAVQSAHKAETTTRFIDMVEHRCYLYGDDVRSQIGVAFGRQSYEYGLTLIGAYEVRDLLQKRLDQLDQLSQDIIKAHHSLKEGS